MFVAEESLENLIVQYLARRTDVTARAIQLELNSYSIQGIHKELRKLLKQGVVLKHGERYRLGLPWILNLMELADAMYETHTTGSAQNLLPAEGEKRRYKISRLSLVDDLWVQLLFLMLKNSQDQTLYQWIPHPWFHLIHGERSSKFHKALSTTGHQVKSIIGGSTFLDRHSASLTKQGAYEFYYQLSPFEGQNGVYYSVTDKYLVSIKLDRSTTESMELVYSTVSSFKGFNPATIVETINAKSSTILTIECGTARVRKVRKQFVEYFEVRKGRTRSQKT